MKVKTWREARILVPETPVEEALLVSVLQSQGVDAYFHLWDGVWYGDFYRAAYKLPPRLNVSFRVAENPETEEHDGLRFIVWWENQLADPQVDKWPSLPNFRE